MPRGRRQVMRAGALALVLPLVGPLAAACTAGYEDSPDPLLPLLQRARADAEAARSLAGSAPQQAELATKVATLRAAQEQRLQAEIDRLNRPEPEQPAADPGPVPDLKTLGTRLAQCRQQALELVPSVPRYRAGLVGSVAAGCAAAQQLDPALGAGQPGELERATVPELPEEAEQALQQALAAEHAAVWVYGLVAAYLPADFDRGVREGAAAHRDRRDAAERVLTAAGATPRPAEPAYPPPEPVTDQPSAMALVVVAETDAAQAWRGVLERTDDPALRSMAADSLLGSATRVTRWRADAGTTPAANPLPGTPIQ
ncbi:ferritin-like domain-containing protein [Amycolatopsis aidingensis]|uniref:ferritin-like domain-containing protein n=1 Tax=Amycolatopsis aidingensis TaxID=2842453 RepID=UPI001C0CB388|nr:ferritin-like domain-containing protein [Amycolatopsis aidingensis]